MPYVFISYLHENETDVQRLCDDLTSHGVQVWLDRNSISAAQFWKEAIREAIQEGNFFIACFSEEFIARTEHDREKTYMYEELTLAIEELRQFSPRRPWFIPVKLSECKVPALSIGAGRTLRDIQFVSLYDDWNAGIQKIISVIQP